jgi:beta-mannosidase
VAQLAVPVTELPDVFLWEAEWRDVDGSLLDLERMIATTTADFAALFDVPETTLQVEAVTGGVRVRNVGATAALTARLVDARPVASDPAHTAGWLLADGDPRPLLPGEDRLLTACWSHTEPGPVRLEAWNAPPLDLDAHLLGTHRVGSRGVQTAVVQ